MKQRSCNNCGAPLKHGYNRKCEYCGTLYDFNESNKIELHSYDLVDLKFRGLQREPYTDNLLMYFEGYKLEDPKIFEYDECNLYYVSKPINYINPPRSFFIISLDQKLLEKDGLNYLFDVIENHIRPTEINNVRHQIREFASEFYKKGVQVFGLTYC